MFFLLAIDTCLTTTGVALFENEHPVAATYHRSERQHASRLLKDIDNILSSRRIGLADLKCIAVTTGPGSFTGLRVGLTTAKSLAYSHGIPVVGVNSLECLAHGVYGHRGTVAVVVDAKKNEVYAALYKTFDSLSEPIEIGVAFVDNPISAAQRLTTLAAGDTTTAQSPRDVLVVGDGALVYADVFSHCPFRSGPTLWNVVHPECVGALGLRRFAQGSAISWEAIEPVYLRKAEAELTVGPPTGIPLMEVRNA
ncbi:MAG: tRNA (adenosine(37)-N6)-threonylcarbamoyltransferase complex dimerization subunit type 1 TsaB [Myxococcales bacterium]|nr:tRNA (adenosine(37)-N6)-threonylcarbamoyltransferase complex dimerization subunit type 1 TsaB [Myxococcales bacterium]